jgi:putative Ca2+/H+ antiporter (TMEM165/GDT1 family)
MDKSFWATFVAIFLAELGDKTQLTVMSMAAQYKSRWMVWLGACLALILSSSIGVFFGEAILRWIPHSLMQRLIGGVFICLGFFYIFQK